MMKSDEHFCHQVAALHGAQLELYKDLHMKHDCAIFFLEVLTSQYYESDGQIMGPYIYPTILIMPHKMGFK